jgi:hypothetical protein
MMASICVADDVYVTATIGGDAEGPIHKTDPFFSAPDAFCDSTLAATGYALEPDQDVLPPGPPVAAAPTCRRLELDL